MKNIYFIEAKSPGAHIFSRTSLPRLGSVLLGTILKEQGYNVKVFIEDIAPPAWKLLDDADLICISSITSTATRALQLSDMFRKKGIPVAIGGPHSTFLPEESLEHADFVIRGEGEETLVELIQHLKEDEPLDSIKGLSYRNSKGDIVHNPPRELVEDLDNSPVPDFGLVYKWEKAIVAPIATSRGCPFDCKFCSVIHMFGRKYRFKSIDRVIKEIKISSPGKKHVFFIDDNFTANKKRTKELLRTMIDSNIRIEWSAQVRTDVAKDPELLELMRKSGCFSVYIGFESINPETLALYNKGQNLEDIENSIRTIKKHHIRIHGMFVLGSDKDNIETIRNTERFAKKLNIESIQFLMLTPLPGTPVFEDLKNSGRLIHTDWSKYDAHHAVFEPKHMTAFELHVETLRAMSKFYSWPAIIKNLIQFDFFYTAVCLYGKKSVKNALTETRRYLDNLREQIVLQFDNRTERLRQFIAQKRAEKRIILNTADLDINALKFFSTFLSKLDRKLVIKKEDFKVDDNALAIMPVVRHVKSKHQEGMQQLSELFDRYREALANTKVINLESLSLYKSCVNIGLLLNINFKKIRKAYEEALKSIGGNPFECNVILVMVRQ